MSLAVTAITPVLPAIDLEDSLRWWVEMCGFTEAFRQGGYAGIEHDGCQIHLAQMTDPKLARTVGDQTMIRVAVADVDAVYAEFQRRGGVIHPNGPLQLKPWGSREFGAIDPCGICVTFQQS